MTPGDRFLASLCYVITVIATLWVSWTLVSPYQSVGITAAVGFGLIAVLGSIDGGTRKP